LTDIDRDPRGEAGEVGQRHNITEELRLRPDRPPVMRLSRKVLISLSTTAAICVSAALIFALYQSHNGPGNGPELYNLDNKPAPDGLANLPRDYAGVPHDVPKIGPLLPGDLGRAILNGQGTAVVDQETQRAAQEQEEARTAKLFSTTNVREQPVTTTPANVSPEMAAMGSAAATDMTTLDPDWLQNMQDRKLRFLNASVDRRTVSPDRLQNAASRYVVQAGSVIAAALITGIRSDLPGQVTAQVTGNVFDSPTVKYLLIPQGARLMDNTTAK
jgi:type IV secretion system protein VirB10